MHNKNFKIAVETNGTIIPPKNIDWICVSPKKGAELNLDYGNELKLVYPQENLNPEQFKNYNFDHFFCNQWMEKIYKKISCKVYLTVSKIPYGV